MIYGSVCSGIEAATVAWHPLGWQPAWFSEIEPFPRAVLAHHYPHVWNHGDMTRYKEWPDAAIDLLVGGTPCQSYSIAGLRKGLDDPRGELMLTYLAIARRYAPRWVVWENVPGVLSSNGGRDFGTLLGGLAELGYGFAYRVLDAQYIRVESHARAVPQRRRRVFVVGYLGDWRRAAAVLFERESMLGHPAPRRAPGQGVAGTLIASTGGCSENDAALGRLIPQAFGGNNTSGAIDVAAALNAKSTQRQDFETETLLVAFDCKASGRNGFGVGEVASTMRSMCHSDSNQNGGGHQAVMQGGAVRRLMPHECERLQGFPDDYTAIFIKGKRAKDGPRYKALGNSMAIPPMRWIGGRIALVDSLANGQWRGA
ncbi:DNA cytosine methyltransferase [Burkholderia stagnalis]|uniref:DNA cytosine methyltransferase n=1 Tax=Burkholderia stagnalis TaxID=1503054 RepID=UPI000759D1C5|nr:DNA cytosine methyltransferase [Burkholderia stagnalis]KVX62884.1 DNA methyltransferase [Burkholderia stagnalis]